jgi:hypothetical protein
MSGPSHKNQTIESGIHAPISFEYANSAARLAAGPFESVDRNKFALQIDTGDIYRLSDPSGPTWTVVVSVAGVSDHGGLSGLSDDDHPQYLLVNGSRAMSDDLDLGTNNIVNVGNIDGRDISADGSALDSHVGNTSNPHGTDLGNLGTGTLSELNSLIIDATLDDSSASRTPTAHASTHEDGGSDSIDGYNLTLTYSPDNYNTPVNNLIGEHIAAIDIALSTSGGGVTDHGALSGLGDDDHPQYLLVNGSRAMSDDLDLGTNNITNVGTVDGRDISADGSSLDSHLSNTSNPHNTSIANIGSGTLSQLNTAISDATLDDASASRTPTTHASTHEDGGSDPLDGYNLSLSYSPDNYNAPINNVIGEHIASIDQTLASIGNGGVTDHGELSGLSDDDHTQYILVNGTRAFTGNINLGANEITNVGNVDGRDISADGSALDGHLSNTSNPHSTSIANIGSGTLSQLNSAISDATLDDSSASRSPTSHASTHESGGSDEIDGYNIEVSFTPENYNQPVNNILGEHLAALDEALLLFGGGDGITDHGLLSGLGDDDHTQYILVNGTRAFTGNINLGTNEITNVGNVDGRDISADGSALDSHLSNTSNPHSTSIANIGSGTLSQLNTAISDATLDDASASRTPTTHASTHEDGGSDEIDGYNISFVFTPENYNAPVNNTLGEHIAALDEALLLFGGGDGITDHGLLSGLSDDDHTQYILVNGTRSFTGNINLGANEITNVGNVDGRDISADGSALDGHLSNTSNPHSTSIANIGSGSLSQLNSAISDATLDDASASRTPTAHASTHLSGGSDEIDGYNIEVSFTPENYNQPVNNILGEHLAALDEALLTFGGGDGITDHGLLSGLNDDDHTQYILVNGTRAFTGNINLGANEITNVGNVDGRDVSADGSALDGHLSNTSNPHSTSIANIGSGTLSQLNTAISDATLDDSSASRTPTAHASTHEDGGSDPLDGYNIAISYSPDNYNTPLNDIIGEHIASIDQTLSTIGDGIITDHGLLSGLSDDDHTQYILVNGTRSFTGNINLGTNEITNVGNIDGRDVSADGSALDGHLSNTSNPHSTSIANIGSGTLSNLNSAISDATLDDASASRTPTAHASTHEDGGSDEIDGYNLSLSYSPDNYNTPINDLVGEHIAAIDIALSSLSGGVTAHSELSGLSNDDHTQYILVNGTRAFTGNINLGANEITNVGNVDGRDVSADGSALDSHLSNTSNPHSTSIANIGSGTLSQLNTAISDATLDDASASRTPTAHASTHEDGGSDEIDGYNIAISYSPDNYNAPSNNIIGEHLYFIDQALAGSLSSSNPLFTSQHEDSGSYSLRAAPTSANAGTGIANAASFTHTLSLESDKFCEVVVKVITSGSSGYSSSGAICWCTQVGSTISVVGSVSLPGANSLDLPITFTTISGNTLLEISVVNNTGESVSYRITVGFSYEDLL